MRQINLVEEFLPLVRTVGHFGLPPHLQAQLSEAQAEVPGALRALYDVLQMDGEIRILQRRQNHREPMRAANLLSTAFSNAVNKVLVKSKKTEIHQKALKTPVSPKKVSKKARPVAVASSEVPAHLKEANEKAWNESAFFKLLSVTPESMQPLKGLERLASETLHSSLKK